MPKKPTTSVNGSMIAAYTVRTLVTSLLAGFGATVSVEALRERGFAPRRHLERHATPCQRRPRNGADLRR